MRVFNRQVILLGVLAWLIGGCTTNEVQIRHPTAAGAEPCDGSQRAMAVGGYQGR